MVDGIGKGGGGLPPAGGPKGPGHIPASGGPGGPGRPEGTGKAFDIEQVDPARDSHAVEKTAAVTGSPLEQLKSGKIDFEHYVEMKLDEATSHLEGIGSTHLETIRSMLRERMATDPELVDLVKQATGHVPQIPEE